MNGALNLIKMKFLLEKKNINVLFRGVSKDNSYKAIVVVQAEEGVLRQQIQENYEIFEETGADMITTIPSLWN